jgi:hypothetical protein
VVYWLGRSAVDDAAIRGYVRRKFFKNAADARAPGKDEEIPDPRPYEAVVFRDFFEAGFVFPCAPFVRQVLDHFKVQLHELSPNAFSRMAVFAGAVRIQGAPACVEAFKKYYVMQYQKKLVRDADDKQVVLGEKPYGTCNFVPRKRGGNRNRPCIAPFYRSKWDNWTKHWFYLRVATDKEAEDALREGFQLPSSFCSDIRQVDAITQPECRGSGDEHTRACAAYESTASHQTSRDIVEELIAFRLTGLEPAGTYFESFTTREDGYVYPDTEVEPFEGLDKDGFVFEVEKIARRICGNYGTKEEDAKVRCLGVGEGARRLNRAFHLGGMVYADRVLPEKAVPPTTTTRTRPVNDIGNATGGRVLLKRPVVVIKASSSRKKKDAVARHAATVKLKRLLGDNVCICSLCVLRFDRLQRFSGVLGLVLVLVLVLVPYLIGWLCFDLSLQTVGDSEMAGGKRAALDASRRIPSSGAAASSAVAPPQVQAVQRADSRLKRTADASIREVMPTSSTAPAGRLLLIKKPEVTSARVPAGAPAADVAPVPVLLPEDITGCLFGRGAVPPPVRRRARAVQIANALGMPLKAQLVGGCDFRAMGIVPDDESRSAFRECASSFGMPEAERDITFEDDLQLEEAVISHGVSVSTPISLLDLVFFLSYLFIYFVVFCNF